VVVVGTLQHESPITALSGGRDIEEFAVFGNRAASDGESLFGEFLHQFFVAVGMGLVFMLNEVEEFLLDGFPGDFFALGGGNASAEKSPQREKAPRCLDPFIIHRATDGGDMHAHLVGDLLHTQGDDVFGAFFEEIFLAGEDGACHLFKGTFALFDGFFEPASGLDFPGQELAGFRIACLLPHFQVAFADA